MKKRCFALLLALALLCALAPSALAAETDGLPVRWLPYESVLWWDLELGLLQYYRDGGTGLCRTDGTELTGPDFDQISPAATDGAVPVQRSGKWGKLDLGTGELSLDFLYATPQETLDPVDAQIVGNGSGLFAAAKLDGTLLTDYRYWNYSPYSYGLAAVQTADGWGYVDENGVEVVPCRYYSGGVGDFGPDGTAWVNGEGGYNLIDRTGREVFETPLLGLLAYRPWRAGCGLWGFYDPETLLVGFADAAAGRVAVEPKYAMQTDPKGFARGGYFNGDGYALVWDAGGRELAIDAQGNEFDAALARGETVDPSGGLSAVRGEDGKYGFRDETGALVVPCVFDEVQLFLNGKAPVQSGGVWGVLSDPRRPWFSDVPDGSWYAPYVNYVAENGVMIGTGEGMFEPERELTEPECLTLALRLYDLLRGGDGALPPAPEDWGWITFTTADGTVTACGEDMLQWLVFGRAGGFYPAIKLLTPEADAWGQGLDFTEMTMAFEDETWTGTAHYASFDKGIGYLYIMFDPVQTGPAYERWFEIQDAYFALGKWYRDAYWNVQRLGLMDDPAFKALYGLGWHGGSNDPDYIRNYLLTPEPCTRMKFACAVAAAAGELERINGAVTVPDVPGDTAAFAPYQIEAVNALYAAGILNGTDAEGSFAPDRTLKRAEAAAMAARVLDPALRICA